MDCIAFIECAWICGCICSNNGMKPWVIWANLFRSHAGKVLCQGRLHNRRFVSQLMPNHLFIDSVVVVRANYLHTSGFTVFSTDCYAAIPDMTVESTALSDEFIATVALCNREGDLRMAHVRSCCRVKRKFFPTLGHCSPQLIRREHMAPFRNTLLTRDIFWKRREKAIVFDIAHRRVGWLKFEQPISLLELCS